MKQSMAFKVILIVLSLILLIFGGWRLLDPAGFLTFSGLEMSYEAGYLSELRGAGGIMLVAGLVVGLGALQPTWSRTSTLLAVILFLPLGLGRLVGLALDGSPGAGVTQGMTIELVLAALALFAFFKYRDDA
jgi:hypothetical protein